MPAIALTPVDAVIDGITPSVRTAPDVGSIEINNISPDVALTGALGAIVTPGVLAIALGAAVVAAASGLQTCAYSIVGEPEASRPTKLAMVLQSKLRLGEDALLELEAFPELKALPESEVQMQAELKSDPEPEPEPESEPEPEPESESKPEPEPETPHWLHVFGQKS